jgi:YidC/Oxa1 family membrane protein insertase
MKAFIKTILYKPLFNALIFLVWLIPGHNVGVAIILLTIVVRLILLPSSLKSARQQKRMQDLQPQIKELQEKYKDDKQKQSQALMEFYKENKINPLGSCLPLLIQLPILIILYYVFINGLNTSRFDLLYSWMPRPEFINTAFLGLDLSQPDKYILPIIAGVLQFIQGWQMAPKKKPGETMEMAQTISRQMLFIMPLFTVFIAGKFPAALPLYWIVTTVFAIGQQWWALRESPQKTALSLKAEKEQKAQKKTEKADKKAAKKGVEITVRKKSK